MIRTEHVDESCLYRLNNPCRCVQLNIIFLCIIVRSYIIQASDMVHMLMGDKDQVEFLNGRADGLQPELRACVNNQGSVLRLYPDRTAHTYISRIVIQELFSICDGNMDTHRGAGSKKCDSHKMATYLIQFQFCRTSRAGTRSLSVLYEQQVL